LPFPRYHLDVIHMYANTGKAISIGDHVPTCFYNQRIDQSSESSLFAVQNSFLWRIMAIASPPYIYIYIYIYIHTYIHTHLYIYIYIHIAIIYNDWHTCRRVSWVCWNHNADPSRQMRMCARGARQLKIDSRTFIRFAQWRSSREHANHFCRLRAVVNVPRRITRRGRW